MLRRWWVAGMIVWGLGAGCVDEPPTVASSNNTTTTANNTTTTANNTTTCEPIASCSAEQCGIIDDGCGGTVECDTPCGCVEGVPESEACGVCGLGRLTCAEGETGEGTCVVPPLPNVAELEGACDERLVFVSAAAPSGGDGSREAPYQKFTDVSLEPGDVLVISNEEPIKEEADQIRIDEAVSILGGYDGDWLFDPESRSSVRPSELGGRPIVGMEVVGVTAPTLIYGIDLETEDAATFNDVGAFGVSNFGLVVRESDDDVVRIVQSTFRAGKGGQGRDGGVVLDGGNGGNGDDGRGGQDGNPGSGGDGGVNPECPSANGGAGGAGAFSGQGGDRPAEAGEDGASGGGNGGSAGNDTTSTSGGDGQQATANAQDGDNGGGGVADTGDIIDGFWRPAAQSTGSSGEDGEHGLGGGGGGGGWFGNLISGDFSDGPGGGGGGAGGCGGTGGQGGEPGGGSIGLVVIGNRVVVEESTFEGTIGGDGGNGSQGGRGGLSGSGGMGSNEGAGLGGPSTFPWSGGDGADGKPGGDGGDGGGGAGGLSAGAFCEGGGITADEDSTFRGLEGGTGGSATEPANTGQRGLAAETQGCPM